MNYTFGLSIINTHLMVGASLVLTNKSVLQKEISRFGSARSEAMIGTTQRILVTGVSKNSTAEISGRTENNRVVNLPGDSRLVGQFLDVAITHALPNSLRGAQAVDYV